MKKNSSISIIGCGWLGFPLGVKLAVLGYKVKGSTRTATKLAALHKKGIAPFLIEVNKKIKGTNLQHFFNSDILIINIPPGRKRRDVTRSHPQQIMAILEKSVFYGVKKILFVSSTSIYGNLNRVVTESEEPQPETASGMALAKVENLLMEQSNFDTSIIRFGGLVGPDRMAGRFLAGKKGLKNGLAPVNMIHQEDAINILIQVIEQACWGTILNACADEHPTRATFYTAQAKKQGLAAPEFLEEATFSYKEVSNYKVKQSLNYTFLRPDPMEF